MTGGFTVSDIANQALDAIGSPEVLGDIEDGSDQAAIVLRAYRQCLQQMLRAAHWDFARRTAPLTLLADASRNTPNVGTSVPQPWVYEYEYPTDCVKARYIPWNWQNQASVIPADNIQQPDTPQMTGIGDQPLIGVRQMPARFLIATDPNNPPVQTPIPWDTMGVSPQGRTVILTNVRFAQLIYTQLMLYPSVWDSLFRSAMVAYLANEIALPIWSKRNDRNFGLRMRDEQAAIVRSKVTEARLVSANEGGPSTSDLSVDWMRTRYSGGPGSQWAWGAGGPFGGGDGGMFGYGCDSLTLAGGAVF